MLAVYDRILRTDKKEHPFIKGYFQNPNYPEIYCCENGNVFIDSEITKKRFIVPNRNGKYHSIKTDYKTVLGHVLIAQTFLEVPKEIKSSRLIVNHINGIPGDDWLDNLEWTSYKGNLDHAFRTGLRSDNTPILVKDLRTGEIQEFFSLWECARYFKVNGARIHWCLLKHRIGVPHFHFYILIRKGMEWPPGGAELIGKIKAAEVKETVVYYKDQKCFVIYATQMQAAFETGVSKKRIRDNLKRARESGKVQYESDNFIFMWFSDFVGNRFDIPNADKTKVTKIDYIHHKKKHGVAFRKPIPIEVTDLVTGEKTKYDSSEIFARKIGVSRNTFQKYIGKNNGIWKKTLKITYLN